MKILYQHCLILFSTVLGGIWGLTLRRPAQLKGAEADECSRLSDAFDSGQCGSYWSASEEKPPLLVISMDGFRHDYLERLTGSDDGQLAAPTIHLLSRCGVWASSGMIPAYPSVTYPNHYSIVTGLYPESHGMVENFFFDPDLNASFSLASPGESNPMWWNQAEPLWYTAKRQNKISASYFWPGSYQTDPIRQPNYWVRYDVTVPFSTRVDQVVSWLKLPVSQRPNFITLYFDEPDTTAHHASETLDSPIVTEQIIRVDQQIKYLLEQLDQEGILGCVDIMVMSDHGMISTPVDRQFIIMEDIVPNISNDALVYDAVNPTIRPYLDTKEERDRLARGLECQNPNMRVYSKWEMPRRYHYSKGNRIPPLLLDMTVGWRAYTKSVDGFLADHGWNPLNQEMQALFVAHGPSFKKALQVRPFQNVDLYNLMCSMIGVDPAPNNGTWGALHHMLENPPMDPTVKPVVPLIPQPYPVDEVTYDRHLQRKKCSLLTGTNSGTIDSTLQLDQGAIDQALQLHTPWGPPSQQSYNDVRILISTDYVSGFDVISGQPLWTSYTLVPSNRVNDSLGEITQLLWRLDVRLEEKDRSLCDRLSNGTEDDRNFTLVPIFPFGSVMTEADMAVDTNAIEISTDFEKYWRDFHIKLNQLVSTDGATNVIIGPVPDPIESPSLFIIVSNCRDDNRTSSLAACPIDRLDQQSFILPTHPQYNRGCLPSDSFFKAHLAVLRDAEQITGIRFLSSLSYGSKVDLLSRTPFASSLLVNPDPNSP